MTNPRKGFSWIKKGLGIALLSLILAPFAQAASISSQRLSGVSIHAASSRYTIKAKAQKAAVSMFAEILAAKDVTLEVSDTQKHTTTTYSCASFTFQLSDEFTTCDLGPLKGSITIDLVNSEISTYSR